LPAAPRRPWASRAPAGHMGACPLGRGRAARGSACAWGAARSRWTTPTYAHRRTAMKVLASTLIGMVVLLVMEERTWGAHERVAVRRQPD